MASIAISVYIGCKPAGRVSFSDRDRNKYTAHVYLGKYQVVALHNDADINGLYPTCEQAASAVREQFQKINSTAA